MKILGICGSPRRGGNSDVLLDECLRGADQNKAVTTKIFLQSLKIAPCTEQEYFNADENGYSPVKDDMELIFREVEASDIIVVASPIFFGSVSAQLKIMIDRFQSVWAAKNIMKIDVFNQKKLAAFICVSASNREDFFANANFVVRHFFSTVGAECVDQLFVPDVEEKGAVSESDEILEKARKLGEKLARLRESEQ